MKVIPFEEKYGQSFIDFNTDWIVSNFGFLDMAMPLKGTTWELCKLGSNKNIPHKGAGSSVFETSMKWALEHGAERIFILSNSKLKLALHIYEKYDFREIKLDDYEYVRGDIAFEYRKDVS